MGCGSFSVEKVIDFHFVFSLYKGGKIVREEHKSSFFYFPQSQLNREQMSAEEKTNLSFHLARKESTLRREVADGNLTAEIDPYEEEKTWQEQRKEVIQR